MLCKYESCSVWNVISIFSILFFLTACDNSPQQQCSSQPVAGSEITKGISLEPRYKATLSEGIVFSKPGYPDFISAIQGISVADSTEGRWTDGDRTTIEFVKPLPEKFDLKISAGAAPYWQDKPIVIRVGSSKFEAKFGTPGSWTTPTASVIPITTDGKASSITLEFPDAKSPKELGLAEEGRKIVLFLDSIKIE